MSFMFGRLPHDPSQLAKAANLGRYEIARRLPPPTLDRSAIHYRPQLFANNQIGDCTAAGMGNAALAVSALNGSTAIVMEPAVVSFYSAVTGYDPNVPGSDRGAVLADVMSYQYNTGFQTGAQLLVGPWATYNPQDRGLMALTMAELGISILGVKLSVNDMNAVSAGDVLDLPPTPGPNDVPGSAGLHCLLIFDYTGLNDTDLVTLPTWGMRQPATWRWVADRVDEAHVVVWRNLQQVNGLNWNGIDYDRMEEEAAAL